MCIGGTSLLLFAFVAAWSAAAPRSDDGSRDSAGPRAAQGDEGLRAASESGPATWVTDCTWEEGALVVSWRPDGGADYYELQLAARPGEGFSAVFSTGATTARLDFLAEGKAYGIRVRAHRHGARDLGGGTWGVASGEAVCAAGTGAVRRAAPSAHGGSLLEVVRLSEGTDDVDYLMDHDSADFAFVAHFANAMYPGSDGPNPLFGSATVTMYCLELLDAPRAAASSLGSGFADYLSCGAADGQGEPTKGCQCIHAYDALLSTPGGAPPEGCHDVATGGVCSGCDLRTIEERHDILSCRQSCRCECPAERLAVSSRYTGRAPFYRGLSAPLAYLYSHPGEGQCREAEAVGAPRPGGGSCTWKQYPEARVVHGRDLLAAGWNWTHLGPVTGDLLPGELIQIKQNAEVLQRAFSSAGAAFQPWSCEALG